MYEQFGIEGMITYKKTVDYSKEKGLIVTVNPYLGSDGVKPFIEVCKQEKKGIFILVKTSNLSSGEFQDRMVDRKPLYELVGEKVDEWGQEVMGQSYNYVGAVVRYERGYCGGTLREIGEK